MRQTACIALALATLAACNDSMSPALSNHPLLRMALASPASASATGAGNTTVAGTLRTFSFTARESQDGSVHGTAQVNNRFVQEMFEINIDCLQVFADLAVMSGVITRHTDTTAIGLPGVFAVRDVGEGSTSSPDSITQVFFFPRNSGVSCLDVTPGDVAGNMAPIVGGNVQVH